jgi:hypothetical protein
VNKNRFGVPLGAPPDVTRDDAFEARVEYVAELLRDLRFTAGRTTRALATEWNVSLSHAQKITAEAGRRVREELTDIDTVLCKTTQALNNAIGAAIATGDYRSVINASKVYADIAGASAPSKVTVEGELKNMSEDEIKARKAEIMARLAAASAPAKPAD